MQQLPPFSIRILDHTDSSQGNPNYLLSLLPASYREGLGDLVAASHGITACIEKELDLDRLASVQVELLFNTGGAPPTFTRSRNFYYRADGLASRVDDGPGVP